jgi:hypothetical protein
MRVGNVLHVALPCGTVSPSGALPFKSIRILYRCWHDRVPYDEAT